MVIGGETTSAIAPTMAAAQLNCGAAQAGRPDLADGVSLAPTSNEPCRRGSTTGRSARRCATSSGASPRTALVFLEPMAEELGEGASGYLGSALAFARASTGDLDGATRAAELVSGLPTATYADRATALTVRTLVAARVGDAASADLAVAELPHGRRHRRPPRPAAVVAGVGRRRRGPRPRGRRDRGRGGQGRRPRRPRVGHGVPPDRRPHDAVATGVTPACLTQLAIACNS